MKPRRRFLKPALIVVVAVGLLGSVPLCATHDQTSQIEALSGPDRLYVCVGRRTYGNWLPAASVLWCAFWGFFAPEWCESRRLRDDLLVFEMTPGAVTRHELVNFGSGGGCYVYQGVLHYSRGGEDWPAVWKWQGSGFERLDSPTALAMLETFRYPSDLLEREGWTKKSFWDPEAGTSFDANLKGHRLNLSVQSLLDSRGFEREVRITLAGHASGDELLLRIDTSTRWLRWLEYLELERFGPAESAPPARR